MAKKKKKTKKTLKQRHEKVANKILSAIEFETRLPPRMPNMQNGGGMRPQVMNALTLRDLCQAYGAITAAVDNRAAVKALEASIETDERIDSDL